MKTLSCSVPSKKKTNESAPSQNAKSWLRFDCTYLKTFILPRISYFPYFFVPYTNQILYSTCTTCTVCSVTPPPLPPSHSLQYRLESPPRPIYANSSSRYYLPPDELIYTVHIQNMLQPVLCKPPLPHSHNKVFCVMPKFSN